MSKPREYIGINPGGDSNALISVLKPNDFNALHGLSDHPEKIHLIEKAAYDALKKENEELLRQVIAQKSWEDQIEAGNKKALESLSKDIEIILLRDLSTTRVEELMDNINHIIFAHVKNDVEALELKDKDFEVYRNTAMEAISTLQAHVKELENENKRLKQELEDASITKRCEPSQAV